MANLLEGAGQKIQKLREAKNLSSDYMAQELGIPESYYKRLEDGKSKIKPEHLEHLAELLETTIEEIEGFDLHDKKVPFMRNRTNRNRTNNKNNKTVNNTTCKQVNNYEKDPSLERVYESYIAILKKTIKAKDQMIQANQEILKLKEEIIQEKDKLIKDFKKED